MSATLPWLIATRSEGKLRELRPIFRGAGVGVIDLVEAGIAEAETENEIESHDQFEANALAKARYFFARAGGRHVVADDSGLEVRALGDAPGVRSKRWSGRLDLSGRALDLANNALLVERMRGQVDRRAQFVCAAAWCGAEGELVLRGVVTGTVVEAPAGHEGFGYDPYFRADDLEKTLAAATIDEKQQVSHRGRAFSALIAALRERRVLRSA